MHISVLHCVPQLQHFYLFFPFTYVYISCYFQELYQALVKTKMSNTQPHLWNNWHCREKKRLVDITLRAGARMWCRHGWNNWFCWGDRKASLSLCYLRGPGDVFRQRRRKTSKQCLQRNGHLVTGGKALALGAAELSGWCRSENSNGSLVLLWGGPRAPHTRAVCTALRGLELKLHICFANWVFRIRET